MSMVRQKVRAPIEFEPLMKVHTDDQYDFYIRCRPGKGDIWNIVQKNSQAPTGGYPNRRYIERLKGVKFPERYQPTLNGMSETYLSDLWDGIEDK